MKNLEQTLTTTLLLTGMAICLTSSSSYGQDIPELPPYTPSTNTMSPEEIAAQLQAIQAARQAVYAARFAPWAHEGQRMPGGAYATTAGLAALRSSTLEILAETLALQGQADRAAVEAFSLETGFPITMSKPDGGTTVIVRIRNGVPRAYTTQNLGSADTIGADELRAGGSTGLGLTGG